MTTEGTWRINGKPVTLEEFRKGAKGLGEGDVPMTQSTKWPILSDAAGVHPGQIKEAADFAKSKGVQTDFTEDGRAIFRSRGHRRDFLKCTACTTATEATAMAEETTTATEETPKDDPLDIVEPEALDFGSDEEEPKDESPKEDGDEKAAPADEDDDSLDDSDEDDEPEEDEEEFDSDVLDRAREIGLGDDAARTLGQATVSALLAKMDQQLATVASKIEAPPKTKEAEADPRHEWKLDPDVWDKEFTDELQRYTDSRDEAFGALNRKVALLEDELTTRVKADDDHRYRSMVTALGDDYKGLLGDGVKLTPDQSKRNKSIREQMTVLAKGREAAGLKAIPEGTLFEQALRSALGDEMNQLAMTKKSGKVRKRRGQFSAPPTHQKSKGTPKSTVQAVGEFMREKGMLEDQDEFSDDF